MSLATFNRYFEAVTANTPLAFQKHVRVMNAQRLIVFGGPSVPGAAFAIGYLSATQFSREYERREHKRMFGASPPQVRRLLSCPAGEIAKARQGRMPLAQAGI